MEINPNARLTHCPSCDRIHQVTIRDIADVRFGDAVYTRGWTCERTGDVVVISQEEEKRVV